MEAGTGFPGYNTLMPKSCGTFAEVLRQNGYNTAWYGKNHNVPDWHTSQAGPFDLWPAGLGFEYFYGFLGGDTSQWARPSTREPSPSSRRTTTRTTSSRRTWPTTPSNASACCTRSSPTSRG